MMAVKMKHLDWQMNLHLIILNVHVYKQPVNMGMGRALRTGFEKSDGDIIITIDADLSYSASHINLLYLKC